MLKVLLALDWSPSGRQTVDFACDLLAGHDAEVTIVHVIPRHMLYGRAAVPIEVYDMDTERAASKALLKECGEYLRRKGVGPVLVGQLAVGDPADLILMAGQTNNVDLIITGSHELNAICRFVMGSTAIKVATGAHCPVLVVHRKRADRA
jgi:nucleotide-binding universal stress UspA family protein